MRDGDRPESPPRLRRRSRWCSLPHVAARLPRELSGGQQQRIALARCLVYRPSIILMDEPLGALDKKLRDQMQLEIKRLHRDLGITILYVTHDQEEALTMSDRICLMNARTDRADSARRTTCISARAPCSSLISWVSSNLLPAQVEALAGDTIRVRLDGGAIGAGASGNAGTFRPGQPVKVMVRPQNIAVTAGSDTGPFPARVTDIMVTGSLTKLYMQPLGADLPPMVAAYPTRIGAAHYELGQIVSLDWRPADAVAIADPTT